MKYTPGPLIGQLSGKAGALVASRNRFTSYFRTRVTPINPNTVAQQTVRNSLAWIASRWSASLSNTQRASWNAAAEGITLYNSLGNAYTPSGFDYFCSVNRNQFTYSGLNQLIDEVPANAPPTALISLTPTATDAPTFSVAYTTTPLAAGVKLVIEATRPLNVGVNFVGRSQYRQIQITAAAAASPANIVAAYNAKFGTLSIGKKIFVRAYTINADGQRSAFSSTSLIVA